VQEVVIPTYPVGEPEKNPMFLEKRVYQGSSGVVYPHPVIEKIFDEKTDKAYTGVFIENDYIKVMILPELGGRLQMAYDKIKQRHFIYYNQVIKPALVGLTGPWISGGIEFNWPQHHRPSTFEPIDYSIQEHADGSKTIWVNEVELMFHTKGMIGYTLYPENAYIEIKGKVYNRTSLPQTFLWWANPAVKVNEHYQSIFPADVHAVYDHGKRDVSTFPIATGEYYKVDYSPGTDISRYKNIPVPTSFMAVSSKYNFLGGYEHDTEGGVLHVADHHVSPGKKQWTWGNGEFGKAWDRNLTDEDGPYIELMAGVYTDNQPDFSWLQPYEEKEFVQYFMPYSKVGYVKNATKDLLINIEVIRGEIQILVYATSRFENLQIVLTKAGKKLHENIFSIAPEQPYQEKLKLHEINDAIDLRLAVIETRTGKELISYQQEKETDLPIPAPADAAKLPSDVENNEQLYLTGLHLEQYRHATFLATDYYEEALKRDPKDVRNNNALGLWYLRGGKFIKAEYYFRRAVKTLTERNPNPYDGEPYFNLGLSLKMQERYDEAYDAFYKSVWNDAWQHAGYLNLARLCALKGEYLEALDMIQKSLLKNYHSHTARHAKVFILRKLNRHKEAISFIGESLEIDPFNYGCLFEKYLLCSESKSEEAKRVLEELRSLSRNWVQNFIEYALDYVHAGLYTEANQLLEEYSRNQKNIYSLLPYYQGWIFYLSGDAGKAEVKFNEGAKLSADFVFPNRIEEVAILQKSIEINPDDAKANYYLGNYWYDKRQYKDAIECWEKAIELFPDFPTPYRNLALAYYNKLNNPEKALKAMEKAFDLDKTDARILMELDQLYKKLNKGPKDRLDFLEDHIDLVETRDDLYLERITLYNHLQEFEKAKQLISNYKFHPWEGGEGKVVEQYLICNLEQSKNEIIGGNYNKALGLLIEAENYPSNLGEGKLAGVQENDINYLKGLALEKMNRKDEAIKYFQKATQGISKPALAIFYNDPQPDKIFYQGLAWIKLDNEKRANEIFQSLIDFGNEHLNDEISIDYFAVSLPDLLVFDADLKLKNKLHCIYMMGLGHLGVGAYFDKAKDCFDKVIYFDKNHTGALIHKRMIEFLASVI
jgi:tetratricopeptide (TPR) repeat protein